MKKQNPIKLAARIKELAIDYVVILIYLLCLLGVNVLIYGLVLRGIPEFTMAQSQLVALLESVIPVVLFFSYLDYKKPYGTIGKRMAELTVYYKTPSFFRSLARNTIKFLPWHLGHMGVIEGIYTEFESVGSLVYTNAGTVRQTV